MTWDCPGTADNPTKPQTGHAYIRLLYERPDRESVRERSFAQHFRGKRMTGPCGVSPGLPSLIAWLGSHRFTPKPHGCNQRLLGKAPAPSASPNGPIRCLRLKAARRGIVCVTRVDGLLVGGPRTVHIALLREQEPEVECRQSGLVDITGVDSLCEGGPRAV